MIKTIWTCWFQGQAAAPPLVQRCLETWEEQNPGWQFRCLDAKTINRYIPLRQRINLSEKMITAASLSDVVRIMLLHEFGGVWADATLYCNRPLDDWLPDVMHEGFFAFDKPDPSRPLASWFLAAEPNSPLVAKWCRRVVDFWNIRDAADDYFWFHRCFHELVESDPEAAAVWERVPKMPADGPHSAQFPTGRMYRPAGEVSEMIDHTSPVFKLTHRLQDDHVPRGSLLEKLLTRPGAAVAKKTPDQHRPLTAVTSRFASLAVSTKNLGDHIQILAGRRLLDSIGISPQIFIDRDDRIHSAPALENEEYPVGILLSGWFKTNRSEWPPNPKLLPLFFSFHIRLFQCPELIGPDSLDYLRQYEPIGCRDSYTEQLLQSNGIEAFTSGCLTLTLPRRIEESATDVFVVSRDDRILQYLPARIDQSRFLSHYSKSNDFDRNLSRAQALLDRYRKEARLVITTLLHCAIPAIAMGIPVIVFYPLNHGEAHQSDRERFTAIAGLVPIYHLDELEQVDWNPAPIDVSSLKFEILEAFFDGATRRWGERGGQPIGPIAKSSHLDALNSGTHSAWRSKIRRILRRL